LEDSPEHHHGPTATAARMKAIMPDTMTLADSAVMMRVEAMEASTPEGTAVTIDSIH
jgi:hypothetical protein